MIGKLGIGGKLLLAFGGVAGLSLLSAGVGWLVFDRAAAVQDEITKVTIPALDRARTVSTLSARIVATSPRLTGAGDDAQRQRAAAALFGQAEDLSRRLDRLDIAGFEAGILTRLQTGVTQIVDNLHQQDSLVARRIALGARFTASSIRFSGAIAEVVDISEALVSNAASNTSATVANLYQLIEPPATTATIFEALDRLIEVDVDHMERMFELRHRVAVAGLIVEQLGKTEIDAETAGLEARFQKNRDIIRRRIGGIRDPNRRRDAEGLSDLMVRHAGPAAADNLFVLKSDIIGITRDIGALAATNQRLTSALSDDVDNLVAAAENRMGQTIAAVDRALRTGHGVLIAIALLSLILAALIMWFLVRNVVVRRVESLAGVTHALAAGDLDVEITDTRSDELSDMAEALQVFRADAVEKRRLEAIQRDTEAELRRHKEELEALIQERTAQLRDANARLSQEVDLHDRARGEAERANRAKSTFLATMSHEIRTPMMGVLGSLRLIDDGSLSRAQHDRLGIIQGSGEALLMVLNDILDYSKIEAGHMILEHVDFDPRVVVSGLLALMRPTADQKGLDLRADFDGQIPGALRGDPGRLRQILLNLVGNAIKFTEAGSVTVQIQRRPARQSSQIGLRVEIADTGIGIEPDLIPHLFDAFYQADSSAARRFQGTGLGLAICRRLVYSMGGDITVDSTLGAGSVFRFDLDLDPGDPARIPAPTENTAAAPPPSAGAELSVLLVKDNDVNRGIARAFLEKAGHRVTEARDGALAVREARNQTFDVILMDISLPVMDGVEATHHIRQTETNATTPIVAMSAHVFQEEVEQYLDAGMNAFLGKPFTPEQLDHVLASAGGAAGPQPPAPTPVTDLVDLDMLAMDLDVIGADVLAQMIALYTDQTPHRVAAMLKAVEDGNVAAVATSAHTIKSASGSLGLLRLQEASRDLEIAAKQDQPDAVARLAAAYRELFDESLSGLQTAWRRLRDDRFID